MKITIIEAGVPTINNRVYPKDELEKAIAKMDDNSLVGRVGDDNVGKDPTKIDVASIAFLVNDVRMEDDSVVGDMTILNTPRGKILEEQLSSFTFVPAGIGMLEDDHETVTDYKFLCVDGILKTERVVWDDTKGNVREFDVPKGTTL